MVILYIAVSARLRHGYYRPLISGVTSPLKLLRLLLLRNYYAPLPSRPLPLEVGPLEVGPLKPARGSGGAL